MLINVLLWDIESPINIGSAIRTCYMLGNSFIKLHIFDPRNIFKEKYKTINHFSSHIADFYREKIDILTDSEIDEFLNSYENRIVCACPDEGSSTDINEFTFLENDLIVFGNEFNGIPRHLQLKSKNKVIVPMFGYVYDRPNPNGRIKGIGTQRCLSLGTSISITLFVAIRQMTQFKNWRDTFSAPKSLNLE